MKLKINTAKQLGNALRQVRKLRKMTQGQVAKKAGIRQATVSDIENGLTSTTEILITILNALDAKLDMDTLVVGGKPYDPKRDING